MPGEIVSGAHPEQGLGPGDRGLGRIQVADAAGYGQPDLRRSQPGRDFVGNGKALKDAFRRGERRTALDAVSAGQLKRSFHKQGMSLGPGRLRRHALEPLGERPVSSRLDELADRELIEGYPGRERPVTRLPGVSHSFAERAVLLIPPSGPAIELGYLAWALTPELQAQHRREERVIAIPSVSDRPDERVRLRQDREDICRRFVIVQLAGNVCAYPVQDARPQEKVPGGGGLGVQHLVYQVTSDGTLLGIEFLSELVRVGVTLQRDGGQADSRS